MKTKKGLIIGVLALTAFSLSSISVVTVHAQTVEEQEQQQAAITTMADGFAFDGAAVQLVKVDEEYSHESSGLRFSFTLTKEAYDLAYENGYSIGVLLVPKIVLDGAGRDASYITYENGKLASEASNTDVVKMELPLDKWTSKTVENVTTYSDYVYLYNFAPEQYNYEIYAKGYVYGVSEDVIYAEDPRGEGCRSVAYVCNGLIDNADEYGYDDTMVTFLSGYLPTYTVSFMDGETVLSDTQVKYGNAVSVPETDPVKDGYIFDGWVDEKGEAFDFSKEITGATKVYASFKVGTIVLTQEMVDNGTFESTIEANMGGNFVLESDLDFSGKTTSPIGSSMNPFMGTFDGQGYTIKNHTGGRDASVWPYDSEVGIGSIICVIAEGAVVKNLGVEYSSAYWRSVAPFGANSGTIENVYVKSNFTRTSLSSVASNTYNAGLVSLNYGVIKNSIVNVNYADTKITVASAVAFENGGVIENTYAISNIELSVAKAGEGQVTDCGVYTSAIDLIVAQGANITAVNGWSDCWTMETVTASAYATAGYAKKTLNFGATQIASIVELSSGVESANFDKLIESNISAYYVLTSDLDFNGITTQPIGNSTMRFTGTIDGQGYTIKNYVGGVSTDNADGGVAARSFIAYVGAGGVVKNLGLEYSNAYWMRMAPIGGNYGTLENLYFKTKFTRASLTNDTSNISGGITSVNYAGGVIKNCIVDVNFAATAITNSNTGAAVGRNIDGTIQNCYAVCNVTALKIAKTKEGTAKETNVGVYTSVVALIVAQGSNITSANGWSDCWTMETVTASAYATAGYAKKTLNFGATQIASIVELSSGVESANFDKLIESDMSAYYVLTSDLDFNGITTQPIGNGTTAAEMQFKGTLDGNGYTIKNYNAGLVTGLADGAVGARSFIFYVGAGATIKNLGLEYVNTSWTDMAPIGYNFGTVENCFFKVSYSRATQTNTDANRSAGIASINNGGGVIKNCIVDITFGCTALTSSYVGIMVSRNINSTISNCFAVSNVALGVSKKNEGTGKTTNSAVYTSAAALETAQSANITVANGWSSYWKVANGAVSFGR